MTNENPITVITSSKRFERVLVTMEKVLSSARAQMDVNSILRDCYGDDLAIFARSEGDNTLRTVLENLLDRVREEVLNGMKESLRERKVESQLLRLERIVQQLDHEEALRKQEDEWDKESAHQALQQAALPKGVTGPDDLIVCAAYKKMVEERDAMLAEIAAVEEETARLEAQRAEQAPRFQEHIDHLQRAAKELEKSADLCSMIS